MSVFTICYIYYIDDIIRLLPDDWLIDACRFLIRRGRWITHLPAGWQTPAGTTSHSWISCPASVASCPPLNNPLETGTFGSPALSQRMLHFQVWMCYRGYIFVLMEESLLTVSKLTERALLRGRVNWCARKSAFSYCCATVLITWLFVFLLGFMHHS